MKDLCRLATIPNVSKVHGLLAVPELNTVYAGATGTNVDTRSNKRIATMAAHSVAIDSRTQLVYLPLENVGGKPVLRIMEERR